MQKLQEVLDTINIPVIKITTEMLRKYLVEYQTINNCGKVTIDNIRRSLSTFFSWLEEEDYIIKSPMKRIHKVKTAVIIKDTIPDEKIEILKVEITKEALQDMEDIYNYIAIDLLAPDNAMGQYNRIADEILT